MTIIPRLLTPDEVEFEVDLQVDDLSLRGNVQASGDAQQDREAEEWVLRELQRGNEYAWCSATVYARWGGYEGFTSLGAISCRSEAEFNDIFLPELKARALDDLNDQVAKHAADVLSRL